MWFDHNIRRPAVSILSNIAEGAGRKDNKEFTQSLYIAMGNLAQLETQLIIAENLSYISGKAMDTITQDMNLIRSQITSLITYLSNKK